MQKRFLDGGGKSDVRKCLEKKGVGACQTLEEMLRRDTFYSHFIEHFIRTIQICIVYGHHRAEELLTTINDDDSLRASPCISVWR